MTEDQMNDNGSRQIDSNWNINTRKCNCSRGVDLCSCTTTGALGTWQYPDLVMHQIDSRALTITFTNKKGETIGKLFEDAEGMLCFEGKAKKSAKVFLDLILKKHNDDTTK